MLKEYIEKDIKLSRKEWIILLCLIGVFSGVFGWLYEVLFYYLNSGMKQIYMRGGNYLPWINIYMYGAFLIIFLTYKRRKHPLQVFLISALATGILEYISGYILYGKLGWIKCWDYNKEILNFGNINGYVCLRSVCVFGFSALLLIYGILPLFIKLVKKINVKILLPISIIIFSIFMIDEVYNLMLYPYFKIPRASTYYRDIGIPYLYFDD
ncbi:MAG: putative ABC transporter permease [Bacilli bacterium]|nr:putative ABC transporter permease [Bacilli bacterium]